MAAPYTDSGSKDDITACKNTQEGDMTDVSAAADIHCNNSTDERLDSVWMSVEHDYNKRTSPPKSPLEEVIDEARNDGGVRKELSAAEYISPLMAPLIHTSNDNDRSLQPINATHLMSMNSNHSLAEKSMIYEYSQEDNQSNIQSTTISSNNKQSLLQKYRTFLQQNQLSIDLLENVMERFVFYGYLFKDHASSGISTELYYAIWNSIRWLNDVVLVGVGKGMGVTVGKRDEWLSNIGRTTSERKEKRVSLSDSILLKLNTAVPILRAILTATTCIYPAMEAWSRRSTIHSSRSLLDNGDNNSIRQARAAQVSYRLERIKFVARLALLSISWWAQQQRSRNQQQDDINDQQKERIPTLLKRGGELDPYEELVPLQEAEDEAKVVQYIGRRTGRRSIAARASSTTPSSSPSSSSQLSSFVSSSSIISNVTILIKRLAKLLSSKHRILYVYAVGELLHILRPLYWSHAETRQYQKQRRLSSINIPPKQSSPYSFGIWKAYFISLMMDLISDKLLQLSDSEDTTSTKSSSETHRRGSLFRGSIGGRQNGSVPSPSAEQAKHDELDWRRSRHSLYLLRSPMYNTVTQPVATLLGRVVSMIPSFGLVQWAVEYVLDMMSYWNENHFMLES